jgi:hypothetical protein
VVGNLCDIINSTTKISYIFGGYDANHTYFISEMEPIKELICHHMTAQYIPGHFNDFYTGMNVNVSLINSNWDPILTHEFGEVNYYRSIIYHLMSVAKNRPDSDMYVRITFEN